MKNHKVLVTVMSLLTLAICANAQVSSVKVNKKQNAQLEKVLQSRAAQARKNACYKCGQTILDKYHQTCAKGGICQQYPVKSTEAVNRSTYTGNKDPHAAQAKTCVTCGKEILSDGQHCSANGYATLCSTVKAKEAESAQEAVSVCPKCGKALSIDERYHGAKHQCEEAQKTCATCGKAILSDGQHCSANGYATLCSTVKAKEAESAQEAVSVCPKCGKALSIDERYHGAKHQCEEAQKTCATCGKEILSDGQHCSANGYATLCSTVKATKKADAKTKHTGHDPHANEAF